VVTPEAKRKAVKHLHESFGQSLRKLSVLLGLSRSSWHYKPKPDGNEPIHKRLRELADERKRWGYRRLHYLLRREGFAINHKRTERLYLEENLMLRVKRRRKMAADSRVAPPKPDHRNQCWAMDFMSDNLYNGRRFRVLNVLDSYNKDYLGCEVDTSINGNRVCNVLERIVWLKGMPEMITVDNGPEFIGKALDAWAHRYGVKLVFNRPGKPVDNTYIESFNGRLRDECLNINWFMTLDHAREVIRLWQKDYNSIRPHSSLGKLTPEEFQVQQKDFFHKMVAS
jgi:putative transposase